MIDGWRTRLTITPVEAIRVLESFFGEFLFTNVDVEGLMQGINRDAIAAVRDSSFFRLKAETTQILNKLFRLKAETTEFLSSRPSLSSFL